MKQTINKVNLQTRQSNVNLAKKIANYLNLDYTVLNRSVIINYTSDKFANSKEKQWIDNDMKKFNQKLEQFKAFI